ncbi:MAG: DUF748 domain-containing protein [Deltaproteobacteria bacterium]|nr:MAG: DUF748 domain-containing protein [Deltaproteobacteria bacterium]
MGKFSELRAKPSYRKGLIAAVASVSVYALLGYLILPAVLKSVLPGALSDALHRKASVAGVRVDPFALSVSVRGLSIAERGAPGTWISAEEIFLNLQLASVFRGGPVLGEARLQRPYVNISRRGDGSYNFSDMINEFSKKQAKESKHLKYSFNNIQIVDGKVDFDDGPKKTRHEVRGIHLAVPFLSNLPYYVDRYIEPSFAAVVNGKAVSIKGKSKPFSESHETSFDLNLMDIEIPRYLEYLPFRRPYEVPSAFLDIKADVSFVQHKDRPPAIRVRGDVILRDAVIRGTDRKPWVRLPWIKAVVSPSDVMKGEYRLASLVVREPEIDAVLDRNRALNLLALAPGNEKGKAGETGGGSAAPAAAKSGGGTIFSVDSIRLSGGSVRFLDESRKSPFRTGIGDIRVDVDRLSTEEGKTAKAAVSLVTESGETFELAGDFTLEPLSSDGSVSIGKFLPKKYAPYYAESVPVIVKSGTLDLRTGYKVARAGGPDKPFTVTLDNVSVDGNALRLEDPRTDPPVPIALDRLRLRAETASTEKDRKARFSFSTSLNGDGAVSLGGLFSVEPPSLAAKAQLKSVSLVPFQPYYTDKVRILLAGGSVSAGGNLSVGAPKGKPLRAAFRGEFSVNDFSSVDKAKGEEFLKFATLHFGGVEIGYNPTAVAIREISLADFYSRIVVNPDGTLNVQGIVASDAAGSDNTAASPATSPPAPDKAAAPPPVRIDTVTLQGGAIRFSDRFVKPNYSANLAEIGGRLTGLSSDGNARADVDLRGKLENSAPLEIVGKINPLSKDLFLDLRVDFRDMELSPLTPYSGRFAGYAIQKGKLSLGLKYRIEKRALEAENKVFLDQFTFGESVDSPTATKLPVRLAVALLKDRKGEIHLDLPVSGMIDDPKFSIWGIVWKIVGNLLIKAATSPFALLGAIFGGGEELSYLEFGPGSSAIPAPGAAKLSNLVKVLTERPALTLEIEGHVDLDRDKEGLRQEIFRGKVAAQKRKELVKAGRSVPGPDNVRVDAAEYPKFLALAYKDEKFPKPRNIIGMAKSLPVPEMEKLMLTHIVVTNDDLRQLALDRASRVRDRLLEGGTVEPGRVFLVEPKTLAPEKKEKLADSRADFRVK